MWVLDQASQAVQAMRESVQEILATEVDGERARATGTFERLGSNLGALGLLIDAAGLSAWSGASIVRPCQWSVDSVDGPGGWMACITAHSHK